MKLTIDNDVFKKLIILFWAFWWFTTLWTDVVGLLTHFNILHSSWAPDHNYPHLVDSLKMYQVQDWIPLVLIIGIILWTLLATLAFIWASSGLTKTQEVWMHRAEIAFIISLSYWLAFFLADQLVNKYELEQNHMVQGGFQLLTYFALYLLPNAKK